MLVYIIVVIFPYLILCIDCVTLNQLAHIAPLSRPAGFLRQSIVMGEALKSWNY